MNINKNQDKGFTLVELLIVIVILGILATVTVFAVNGITTNAKTNACAVEAKNIETSAAAYTAENDGAFAASDANLLPYGIEQTTLDKFAITYAATGITIASGTGTDACTV